MTQQIADNNVIFREEGDGAYTPTRMVTRTALAELPPGIYEIIQQVTQNSKKLYLQKTNSYNLDGEVFGSVSNDVKRYLRSFEASANQTMGVSLVGIPGSGKTVTMKALFKTAIGLGYPVILVTSQIAGDELSRFLAMINQTVVVGIDEFDKTYYDFKSDGDEEAEASQMSLLPLFDGNTGGGRKLFVISANDENKINDYFKQRPGRIRYTKTFTNVSFDVTLDYINRKYPDTKLGHKLSLLSLAMNEDGWKWNFDSLKEVLVEMQEFKESPIEAIDVMFDRQPVSYYEREGVMVLNNNQIDVLANFRHLVDDRVVVRVQPKQLLDEVKAFNIEVTNDKTRSRESAEAHRQELAEKYKDLIFSFLLKDEMVLSISEKGILDLMFDEINLKIKLKAENKVASDDTILSKYSSVSLPKSSREIVAAATSSILNFGNLYWSPDSVKSHQDNDSKE